MIFNDIINSFKNLIAKANAAPIPTPLKDIAIKDQKAVITKALNRYIKHSLSPVKIAGSVFDGVDNVTYSVIIVPNEGMALVTFMRNEVITHDRLSFKRLSDYIVSNDGFAEFSQQIPKVTSERKHNESLPIVS